MGKREVLLKIVIFWVSTRDFVSRKLNSDRQFAQFVTPSTPPTPSINSSSSSLSNSV